MGTLAPLDTARKEIPTQLWTLSSLATYDLASNGQHSTCSSVDSTSHDLPQPFFPPHFLRPLYLDTPCHCITSRSAARYSGFDWSQPGGVAPDAARDVPPVRRALGGGDKPVSSCMGIRPTRALSLIRRPCRTDSTPKLVESVVRDRCHAPASDASGYAVCG
jgi:hypothetical protein